MERQDAEQLDKVSEAFYLILKGKTPEPIDLPEGYPENEVSQAVMYINRFIDQYNGATDMAYALSRGDIDIEPPRGSLMILQSLKGLHASLKNRPGPPSRLQKGILDRVSSLWGIFQKPSTIWQPS